MQQKGGEIKFKEIKIASICNFVYRIILKFFFFFFEKRIILKLNHVILVILKTEKIF